MHYRNKNKIRTLFLISHYPKYGWFEITDLGSNHLNNHFHPVHQEILIEKFVLLFAGYYLSSSASSPISLLSLAFFSNEVVLTALTVATFHLRSPFDFKFSPGTIFKYPDEIIIRFKCNLRLRFFCIFFIFTISTPFRMLLL